MHDHILITAVDSPTKHGLDGIAIRQPTEEKAIKEFLEWIPLLTEEWKEIYVSIVAVGGKYDPENDGQEIGSFSIRGETPEKRAEMLRNMMATKEKVAQNLNRKPGNDQQ